MMDIQREFQKLKIEHETMESELLLHDQQDVVSYLTQMCPLEFFLKRIWQSGAHPVFWDHQGYYNEKNRFYLQFEKADISPARHFRYDQHMPHAHDFFQMNYVLHGEGIIFINDDEQRVQEGCFLLLAPKTVHHIQVWNDDCSLIKFYIRKSTFEKTFFKWLGESNLLSMFFNRALYENGNASYLRFETFGDESLKSLVLRLYAELINHQNYSAVISDAVLTEIFCYLIRDHTDTSCTQADENSTVNFGKIIQYIQKNYRTATLDEVAAVSGYSKTYLCRLIVKMTERTFCEIVNQLKIEAACQLLVTSDFSISEIGYHAGFHSQEHFYRVFKQIRGMTPNMWRKHASYKNQLE